MSESDLYSGREQTLVKHFILKKYLQRFAFIVGSHWDSLTYVDCFSGPWNARSDRFEDSSFAIALKELRNARDALASRGRSIRLRCFFLEKDPKAFAKLNQFACGISDAEVKARNAALEDSTEQILRFVRSATPNAFSFVFIDPTGWTGFAMQTIAPLLRHKPGEVLINFMTSHIRRFLEDAETQESFERLFGSTSFKAKVHGLAHLDREDAAVEEYTLSAKRVGDFQYGCKATVLHPEIDRTHFNLVYLTRNPKGVEVFKDAEKKAMEVQEATRAEAKQRKRVAKRGQTELFDSRFMHDSVHYYILRDRYLSKANSLVAHELKSKRKVLYEHLWLLAVSQPLVWESDLKRWIGDWMKNGRVRIEGLRTGQRVPHRDGTNYIVCEHENLT